MIPNMRLAHLYALHDPRYRHTDGRDLDGRNLYDRDVQKIFKTSTAFMRLSFSVFVFDLWTRGRQSMLICFLVTRQETVAWMQNVRRLVPLKGRPRMDRWLS